MQRREARDQPYGVIYAEMRGVSVVIRRHVLALHMCAAHSCARGGAAGERAARLRWRRARKACCAFATVQYLLGF